MDPREPRPPAPVWRPSVRQRAAQLALRASARLLNAHPIVLEYPPPDPGEDRWGWGSPPNQALSDLLSRHLDAFRTTIRLIEGYQADLRRIALADPPSGEPSWARRVFTGIDAASLYSFVRARAPAHYCEVGSGNSTLFAARAVLDAQLPTRIVSIDPHPLIEVDRVCDRIVRAPLQHAVKELLGEVTAGDILLLDGSHYVLKGSDVVVFFLEVLPALPAGVLIGIHDVFLPDDYPWWLDGRWLSEQYLLAAWLLGVGDSVKLQFASHYCATEPAIRAELGAAWERIGVPAIPYGSLLWFES